jgi:deoxyadenosine/deoxycytidine kinase
MSTQLFSNKITIISIEGNIGSGKSTLLKNLKTHSEDSEENVNIIFLKEPVDDWESIKDIHGVTMLEKFYSNQEKYSFSFQMMAYISRLALLKDAIEESRYSDKNTIIITERSLYTDKYVFAKMLYESQLMEDVNYQIYCKWFTNFAKECPLHKIIYVNTDPLKCCERIAMRSRSGEEGIPMTYLIKCHKYHETMMLDETIRELPILMLDGNDDIHQEPEILEKWIQEIDEFIIRDLKEDEVLSFPIDM